MTMASSRSRRSLRTPPRASTRTKPGISYAESSSDDGAEANNEVYKSESDHVSPVGRRQATAHSRKPPTPTRKRTRSTAGGLGDGVQQGRHAKRRIQAMKSSPPKKPAPTSSSYIIQTSGVVPPWQTLPYQILVQVFQYATYPLYDDHNFQPLPSGSWLLKVARLCRSFAEPAFTVLLMTPPLIPMDKAHNLVDLLKADPRALAFKYRQKVESLQINVGQVAAYSLAGRGHLPIFDLIKDLPRLSHLQFYHEKDMSPYRDLDDHIKWTYPANLFEALEHVDPNADPAYGDKTSVCKLRNWRWSSRLAGKTFSINTIRDIHVKPSFGSLQKIAFVNYQVPYTKAKEEDPKHERVLAESLSPLKNLQHLIFESSTLVNSVLLPLLPQNLRNVELINCWNLKAEEFADFLLSHGSQLRCLTLNHNQSLNLSFLPVLRSACPSLEVLRMNLNYFQLHSSYRDSDPLYDHLLLPGQVPAWPSTLQVIELTQLRKWETEAAEMLFQSLLDSAADLPDLRRLTVQAILNIGWRDRASFRDRWIGALDRIFKRVSTSPRRHVSLRDEHGLAAAAAKEEDKVNEKSSQRQAGSVPHALPDSTLSLPIEEVKKFRRKPQTEEAASPPGRRSMRTTARQIKSGTYAESSDESNAEGADSGVRSARSIARTARAAREIATLKQTAGRDLLPSSPPQTPEDQGTDTDDEPLAKRNKGKGKATEIIQGMCEIVNVRIDNLRPTETQVTEADFLDDEVSGDDDWNGENGEEEGYAW